MIIYFVETEGPERSIYREELPGHDVRFVDELAEVPDDAEAVSLFINSPVDEGFVRQHPRLRFITTRSGSTDHLNLSACRDAGIAVGHVPEYGDHTVAEHTFALILALSRRLREIMAASSGTRRFSYESTRAFDLYGKTLGVIGLGHIGRRVATLAQAFHMQVVAYDPLQMPPERAASVGARWASFDELLAEAHVISLHVRLSPWTHHLLNADAFAKCRPGVLIINTSRGRLIDTSALQDALESGQVGGAGLDVLEQERVLRETASKIISEQIVQNLRTDSSLEDSRHDRRLRHLQDLMRSDALLARTNVVYTPHVAFNSVEAVERLIEGTIRNLRAFAAGEPINLVVE